MKFSIIMPTYNDCDSISETLESIISQDYQNWELLISDDGSTDDTKKVVDSFIKKHKEKRIKYFHQDNQDQLNAILNVTDKITGDYVYILHSDDLFYDEHVLSNALKELEDTNIDAIISSPIIIDEKSNITGIQKVKKYVRSNSSIALQLLWMGRNLYIDFAFHKKESFITNVLNNYLTWNTPFWLKLDSPPEMLNVKNVNFPFFKYRVFEGNYINNPIGKLNVINGELRTAINLMYYYNIPFYKFQYIIFRALNKFRINYNPIYNEKETKNKYAIIKFIIKKRYNNEYKKNKYLYNLLEFYKTNSNRTIKVDSIDSKDFIYYGKDMRRFNKDLLNNKLSKIYEKIIDEMKKGFSTIEVRTKEDKEKMAIITKFLCIDKAIDIKIKGK